MYPNLEKYFRAIPEICIERPRLITRLSIDDGLFDKKQISILDKANTYRYVLEHREPIIQVAHDKRKLKRFELPSKHVSLFAGLTTSKFKGIPIYPEFLVMTLWPELRTISERARRG